MKNAEKISLSLNGKNYKPVKPMFLGTKTNFDISIEKIEEFIDWKPFFNHGNYMEIFHKF